jgi:hypothetical protein
MHIMVCRLTKSSNDSQTHNLAQFGAFRKEKSICCRSSGTGTVYAVLIKVRSFFCNLSSFILIKMLDE